MSDKTAKKAGGHPTPTGIKLWLKSGKINPSVRGHRRLQAYLKATEESFIRDMGGPGMMTTAQEVLLKATLQAYGVLLLAGAYCQKYSILRPDQARRGVIELQPVLSTQYVAFLNSIRQNLVVLGVDRRKVDEALDVTAYIQARDAQRAPGEAKGAVRRAERPQDGRSAADGIGTTGAGGQGDEE
jgi:hypothetical protein